MRWQLGILVASSLLAGCANDTIQEVAFPDAGEEDVVVSGDGGEDVLVDSATDATVEDTLVDVATETASDSTASDGTATDTGSKPDSLIDTSTGTFACGTETCNAKLQFCKKDTSPGTCPPPDSGTCPAGCPGCAPLGRHCVALPAKCAAAPTCMCLVGEVCGFAGMCDSMDGFTIGCTGA